MKFFNTLSKKIKQKIFGGFFSRQISIPPNLTTEEFLREYGKIGWLYASVSKIAQNVADTEWKAYNEDGEPVDNSMALQVLLNPNPFYSLYETLELTSMYLDLTGKAFWYLAKDALGRVKEIWVISPTYMYIYPDFQTHIKGYAYQDGATRVPLDVDEVIFFNYPDPTNPYNGYSPAKAVASALESDKYASQWNRNFFYNSAEPQGVIEVPNGLTKDEYDRLKEDWNDRYGGVDNAKKTAIIEGGATYKSIQINQKDMDFANLRNMNRDEILGVFGVPKSILGLTDNVNRANAETAEYTFTKHTVTPRIQRIEGKINNEFVPLFNEDVKLKHTDIIPINKDFILAVLNGQVDKTLTKDEGRQILSKLISMDLDPIKFGDVIYQNPQLQPLGTPLMPPIQITPQPTGKEAVNQLTKMIYQSNKKIGYKKYFKSLDKDKYQENFVKEVETNVKKTTPIINEIFSHQYTKLLENIKNGQGKKCTNFLNSTEEKTYMRGKLQPVITQMFTNGYKRATNQLQKALVNLITKDDSYDVNTSFDLHNPLVSDWILNNTLTNIDYINTTTELAVKDLLSECEKQGFSIQEIGEALKQFFPSFSKGRLEKIARTEVVSSTNAGCLHGYKQSGDVEKKEWISTNDMRTREAHRKAMGQTVGVNDNFSVGGEHLDFPGDPKGSAGNIINCRCCILANFDE